MKNRSAGGDGGAWRASRAAPGALPPDPRDLSRGCQPETGRSRPMGRSHAAPRLGLAPESALGLLPSRALSSAQAVTQYSDSARAP